MLKRLRSSLVMVAAVALASCSAFCTAVVDTGLYAFHRLRAWAGDFAMGLLCGPQPISAAADSRAPAHQKAKECQFAARIEKRERPTITGSWRMCPSC